MNWKRTKASSALWILLTIVTCIAGFYGVFGFCGNLGIQGMMIWVVYAGVLLFGGLFSVFMIRIKEKFFPAVKDRTGLWMLLESLLFVAVLAGGILLRIHYLKDFNAGSMYYVVTMKYGETFPNHYLGAEDIYLRILHGICFLFGNTTYFLIRFHLIITILAGVVWYFAVRKLSGRIPALVFLAFYCLLPFIVLNSLFLTAEPLIFLFHGIGLWMVGAYFASTKRRWIFALVAGMVAGMAGFMDVFGFLLLFVTISAWHMDGEQKRESMKNVLSELGLLVGGACAGFFLSMLVKALTAGVGLMAVANEWINLYAPRSFVWPGYLNYLWSCLAGFLGSWTGVLLIFLLVFTIFGFLMKEKTEKISPWVSLLVVSLIAIYLQMPPAISGIITMEDGMTTGTLIDVPFDGCLLVLACLFAFAGIGIESVFVPAMIKQAKQADSIQGFWERMDPRRISAWIRKKKTERKEKLAYAMEHPESMENKGVVSKFLVDRAKKKAQAKQEIDKVMHALNSLSEDHIVWTDGIKPSKNLAKTLKDEKAEEKERAEERKKAEEKEKAEERKKAEEKEHGQKKAANIVPDQNEPVKEEPVKEESAKEEPAKEESVKEEPVKEEPAKEESAKEETIKTESEKEAGNQLEKEASARGEDQTEDEKKDDSKEAETILVEADEEEASEEKRKRNASEEPEEEMIRKEVKNAKPQEASEMDDIEILDLDQEEAVKKEPKTNYNKKLASVLEFDYEAVDDEDYEVKE